MLDRKINYEKLKERHWQTINVKLFEAMYFVEGGPNWDDVVEGRTK
jgi:hypothetical protein